MHLPPETESGNIEYKLKIIPENQTRLIRLSTQLKWRCLEGNGLAIYFIGITDTGKIEGITPDEFNQSMTNLGKMVALNKGMILQNTINKLENGNLWSTIFILNYDISNTKQNSVTYTFSNLPDLLSE